jgi:predicted TIM-barrel fold metal-dependent hydrolase
MSDPVYTIIDADTHLTEPRDVWTSRVSSKWKDRAPHVERDPDTGDEVWVVDGQRATSVGMTAVAGWRDPFPAFPPTYEESHPGAYDAKARLSYMDGLGIWAAVLYPNVGGFGNQAFLQIEEPEFKLECVRAYNDFLVEWVSADPRRLIPVMATPFWDVAETVAEIERCAALGHRGVLFTGEPQNFGLPFLADRRWDPVWAAAQDAGLPISFHIGSGDMGDDWGPERSEIETFSAAAARGGSRLFLHNGAHILDLLFSGILARFPKLKFVSVESGVGWVPFILQSADYQFTTLNVRAERPDLEMLPSEYFHRQVYACCWFEKIASDHVLEWVHADRIMFETDFPHPTSIYAQDVPATIEAGMAGLPEATRRQILWDNAAALYGVESPGLS